VRIHRQLMLCVLIGLVIIFALIGVYLGVRRANYLAKYTPLLCRATERGDLTEVKRLIALGASPSREEDNGEDYCAPLDIAIACKHFPVVRYLVEHGAGRFHPSTDDDRLNVAAGIGSPEILAYLMQRYPDHDKARLLYYAAGGHYAARYDGGWQIDNVKYLLAHGAQPGINRAFDGGERALHVAETPEIAAYLLSHGAQLAVKDNFSCTPLFGAVASGHLALVKFYVEKGLDVNAKDSDGKSSLMYANATSNPKVIAYLKAHGAK